MNDTDLSGERSLCQVKNKGLGLHWLIQRENLGQSTLIECPLLSRSWDSGRICDVIKGLREYHMDSEREEEKEQCCHRLGSKDELD